MHGLDRTENRPQCLVWTQTEKHALERVRVDGSLIFNISFCVLGDESRGILSQNRKYHHTINLSLNAKHAGCEIR